MPRSDNDKKPKTYVASGSWPNAVLRKGAPLSAHFAQAYVRKLTTVMNGSGVGMRELAEMAGVSHTTVSRFLNGGALPDMGTLIRIEVALGTDVWPGIGAVAGVPLRPPADKAAREEA